MTSSDHAGHAGLDQDTRASKGPKLRSAASSLLGHIGLGMREIASGARHNGRSNGSLRSSPGATRDYASLFKSLPEDYPEWLRPNRESTRLLGMPAEREQLLAVVRRVRSNDSSHAADGTSLLGEVLGGLHSCIDISGLPNGGKSLIAKAL
jgi:hypothetical protein